MSDLSDLSLDSRSVDLLETYACEVESGVKLTVEGILDIGKALAAARDVLKGDNKAFGKWRETRLPFLSRYSALNFIQVYEKFGDILLKNNSSIEFYTPTLLYLLAAPSVPDSVVIDIKARLRDLVGLFSPK